jgi:uncharacterized Zn finger protein (UPF0148 family)
MVEFCTHCGTSLPKGDFTVKKGKLFTSPDYSCPSCGKIANPEKEPAEAPLEPGESRDIVFKKGQASAE